VSLFSGKAGATVYSDGLAEYEATPAGDVFVTLVRAVGELSRNDLPERPGHAGWPAHTPDAQSIGPFEAQLALMLHGARDPATVNEIERIADDVLLPLDGQTLRSALTIPPRSVGVQLEGECLAFSAIKESDDGNWLVVRCVNLVEQDVEGSWLFGFPIEEAHLARLDETSIEPLAVKEGAVSFHAPPRAIVTVIVR
jgi:alpha-mannosidase